LVGATFAEVVEVLIPSSRRITSRISMAMPIADSATSIVSDESDTTGRVGRTGSTASSVGGPFLSGSIGVTARRFGSAGF
jgi:hypothetical protein